MAFSTDYSRHIKYLFCLSLLVVYGGFSVFTAPLAAQHEETLEVRFEKIPEDSILTEISTKDEEFRLVLTLSTLTLVPGPGLLEETQAEVDQALAKEELKEMEWVAKLVETSVSSAMEMVKNLRIDCKLHYIEELDYRNGRLQIIYKDEGMHCFDYDENGFKSGDDDLFQKFRRADAEKLIAVYRDIKSRK